MSEKVTSESLKKYATEFCAIVLTKAYQEKETLSGHDLLNLTPVRKINQHIVSRLSSYWNGQIQQFNSPYFDFGSEEVRSALEHFSNVVSQHISLKREHLQPWLIDITDKTLAPLASVEELSDSDEALIRQFSSVHPLTLQFAEKKQVVPETPREKSFSFFNLAETEHQSETSEKEEPAAPAASHPETAPTPVSPPARNIPESVNSRFKVALPQYSDDVHYGSVKVKLESIGQSISLAQRFMFVGQLFKGDFDAFSESVKSLDSAENLESAYTFITQILAEKYNWDLNSEAAAEFIALTKRRFS